VTGLFDSANQIVNRYAYHDFGTMSKTEPVAQPLRYVAREHDVRARWDDPGTRGWCATTAQSARTAR
jgi:hypothetical protein